MLFYPRSQGKNYPTHPFINAYTLPDVFLTFLYNFISASRVQFHFWFAKYLLPPVVVVTFNCGDIHNVFRK